MDAESDIPVARPVEALAYATPRGADEVPEFVPIAEAALDRRASIRAVTSQFRSTRVAAEYVRRSLARRFHDASAGNACLRCGRQTRGTIVYGWSFFVPGRWLTLSNQRVGGQVQTCHAWCDACAEPLRRRVRRLAHINRSAIWLAAIGGSMVLLAIVVPLVAGLRQRLGGGDAAVAAALWIGLTGIAVFLSSLILSSSADTYARVAVPRAIRRALPRWLTFQRFIGAFERERVTVAEGASRCSPDPAPQGPA